VNPLDQRVQQTERLSVVFCSAACPTPKGGPPAARFIGNGAEPDDCGEVSPLRTPATVVADNETALAAAFVLEHERACLVQSRQLSNRAWREECA